MGPSREGLYSFYCFCCRLRRVECHSNCNLHIAVIVLIGHDRPGPVEGHEQRSRSSRQEADGGEIGPAWRLAGDGKLMECGMSRTLTADERRKSTRRTDRRCFRSRHPVGALLSCSDDSTTLARSPPLSAAARHDPSQPLNSEAISADRQCSKWSSSQTRPDQAEQSDPLKTVFLDSSKKQLVLYQRTFWPDRFHVGHSPRLQYITVYVKFIYHSYAYGGV